MLQLGVGSLPQYNAKRPSLFSEKRAERISEKRQRYLLGMRRVSQSLGSRSPRKSVAQSRGAPTQTTDERRSRQSQSRQISTSGGHQKYAKEDEARAQQRLTEGEYTIEFCLRACEIGR